MTAQHVAGIPTADPAQTTDTMRHAPEHWTLHPDRALPADPVTRPIAREIYAATTDLPIVSMHGHVDAQVLDENPLFGDPLVLIMPLDHPLAGRTVSFIDSLPARTLQVATNPSLVVDTPATPTVITAPDDDRLWLWQLSTLILACRSRLERASSST